MTRHDLFPSPLWHIKGAPLQLIDELYQGAYTVKKKYTSKTYSNQGGYQSPNIAWEDFHPEGIKYVNTTLSNIFKDIKVQGWWFNINSQGHWNIPHTHPGSDLALVLYLTDSDGLLQLVNPHSHRLVNESRYSTDKDSDGHWSCNFSDVGMKANKGDIVIFPSDLVHYVMPNPREEDRISVSMNLQLCGN